MERVIVFNLWVIQIGGVIDPRTQNLLGMGEGTQLEGEDVEEHIG